MGENKLLLLIETAIEKEEEAFIFYTELMAKVEDKSAKDTLAFVANEEKKHKEFLIKYRDGHYGSAAMSLDKVIDYKIAEHLDKPDPDKKMDNKDVYLIAAHRELSSYHFYMGLADISPAGKTRDLLAGMANEEMKHKEKMEYLYSNTAFPQTDGG